MKALPQKMNSQKRWNAPLACTNRSEVKPVAAPPPDCLCVFACEGRWCVCSWWLPQLWNERVCMPVEGGRRNSWFAHLAVNQPFDVPNTNRVIYNAGGGSDELEVTGTLSPLAQGPPISHVCFCCLPVVYWEGKLTVLFSHRLLASSTRVLSHFN